MYRSKSNKMALNHLIQQFLSQDQFNNLQVPQVGEDVNLFHLSEIIGIKSLIADKDISDDFQYAHTCFLVCIEQN